MASHPIQITELSIHPIRNPENGSAVKAFVRIVLNDAFVINGLRVVNGKFGQFVVFPRDNGKNTTLCFPIRKDLHEEMSRTILNEYRLTVSQNGMGGEGG